MLRSAGNAAFVQSDQWAAERGNAQRPSEGEKDHVRDRLLLQAKVGHANNFWHFFKTNHYPF